MEEQAWIHAYSLDEYLYRDDDRGLMSRVCSLSLSLSLHT